MQFRDERKTCLLVASGPSAGTIEFGPILDHPARPPIVCVNDGYRLCRGADATYAADPKWWAIHAEGCREAQIGELWTQDGNAAQRHGLHHIKLERGPGLSHKPDTIRSGGMIGNSGAQAINLAFLWGARRLLLIGFDMRDKGPRHFFGDHPKPLLQNCNYSTFVHHMGPMASDLYAAGVEVINCSPQSALPYWKKTTLDKALVLDSCPAPTC